MKTMAQLEIENAELRGQVKALREMLESVLTKPAAQPQFIPAPCPWPHVPVVTPQPYQPWPWHNDPMITWTTGITGSGGAGAVIPNIPWTGLGCSS